MSSKAINPLGIGSIWNRWEPHIHAPGTLLSNEFKGTDAWEKYITAVEEATPPVRALGVTDYWNINDYKRVVEFQRQGRLPNVGLVFPNVEFRLNIQTAKSVGINLHLLFSPDDPDHVYEIERFLSRLEFGYQGNQYPCTEKGLISLGYAIDTLIVDDRAALLKGANQFKVSFSDLQKKFLDDAWARDNCLVAVSGSSNDGTAGLSADDSYNATREEIERFTHIIFASQTKQRDFWLGKGVLEKEALETKYGGLKPCLHGSDAHTQARVCVPFDDRFSWIKGSLTFESLRQACIEPENRAVVSRTPPSGASPSNVITQVEVKGADWLPQGTIPLNPGIVAVIGARGSGKTALADLIAAGGNSLSRTDDRSFVRRAKKFLYGTTSTLSWESGPETSGDLDEIGEYDWDLDHRVQYLSQQFVDQLCSAEGLHDSLLAEIERVIFDAHQIGDRLGTVSFRELLGIKIETAKTEQRRAVEDLSEIADSLGEERARKASLPRLQAVRKEKADAITKTMTDRAALLAKGKAADAAQLEVIRAAVNGKRSVVGQLKQKQRALRGLENEVQKDRSRTFPGLFQTLQTTWQEADLTPVEWGSFAVQYKGDVNAILSAKLVGLSARILEQEGPPETPSIDPSVAPAVVLASFLPKDIAHSKIPLRTLERELTRLTNLMGVDAANAQRLGKLSEKLSLEEGELKQRDIEIERAKAAEERIKELQERRTTSYRDLMEAIVQEESELADLYEPLAKRLKGEAGSLGKLSFYVRRDVDLKGWAERGEKLLDLRKAGDFKGKGSLYRAASELLLKPWATGNAIAATEAMTAFRGQYDSSLLEFSPIEKTDKEEYQRWSQRIGEWLYSTDHISVSYDLQYDGIRIEQLSPGTRGIVLLLLYLAVDAEDTRPLIIDQPEENLDPQSVVRDLVSRFREARSRRQIIIVTHNANLVVNTDVDQVIVARSGAHVAGELPTMEYVSGGLEDAPIRQWVCDILEGGDRAFRDRARRLRLDLRVS